MPASSWWGGALLWALPEIVRRVALNQIPKHTGRSAAIDDIDLNLFTGRLAIKGFHLTEREGPEPFVTFERLDVRLSVPALVRSHVRLREIALAAPSIRVVRTGPLEFNFSDLLAGSQKPAPEPAPAPSRWIVTVERLSVAHGRVRVDDRAVSPPADWMIEDLGVEASSITTTPGATPGRLTFHARINEAILDLSADPLRLEPVRAEVKLALNGFETRRLTPYVYAPLGTPYRPKGGRLDVALSGHVDSDAEEVKRVSLAGTATVESQALAVIDRDDPFVSVGRIGVDVKEADVLRRTLTVASVAIDGLDLKARRDAKGIIDLIELFTAKRAGSAPPPKGVATRPPAKDAAAGPPVPPAASAHQRSLFPIIQGLALGFEQIRVERITLTPSTATFVDDAVKPRTTLALTKLQARIDDFTWPVTAPAKLALSTRLPGGGTLDVRGPVSPQPFDAELTMTIRDAPVKPYLAYIPVPARLTGRFNGDSWNRIALRDGQLVVLSKGNSWAQDVEIHEPGAERPAIRVERMELIGIDVDWPKRAAVAKAGFRRPRVEVDREADGAINLRRLFTAPEAAGTPAPGSEEASGARRVADATKPAEKRADKPTEKSTGGLLETMQLDVREVRIEDGFIRFLDRTTTPAFSQDLSRLDLTVTGIGNRRGQRAKLALQSVVGGDAGLDIRGEISSVGSPMFVDLVGELRSFRLTSVNPYAAANIGWAIKKGELQYKVRFTLDDGQLTASNEAVVGQLQVAPAKGGDEVKRRLGLPLALIVALVKDQKGEIRVDVPVTGSVHDPRFDLRDTIWTAVKNVLLNVVTAPFKAIGRLFSKAETLEEPTVEPVTFAAGSSVLSPAMEDHLIRVADFLRQAPFASLTLRPVSTPADVDELKGEVMTARLREFQEERGLADAGAALAAYYKERWPDVALPPTLEEQVALLRQRESVPDAMTTDLGRRRLEATRERLVAAEGIPAARLTVDDAAAGSAPPDTPAGEGRIEFGVVAGEE